MAPSPYRLPAPRRQPRLQPTGPSLLILMALMALLLIFVLRDAPPGAPIRLLERALFG